jgi:hypothetical protein
VALLTDTKGPPNKLLRRGSGALNVGEPLHPISLTPGLCSWKRAISRYDGKRYISRTSTAKHSAEWGVCINWSATRVAWASAGGMLAFPKGCSMHTPRLIAFKTSDEPATMS